MGTRVTLICEGHGELEIPANPYPMYPHVEVLNTVTIDSATGLRHTFVGGPVRVNSSIFFKCLDHTFVRQYEYFLLNVVKLGTRPFKITCPEFIDFGLGKGNDINRAYYAGPPTLKDIITLHGDAGLLYDIELPYITLRAR